MKVTLIDHTADPEYRIGQVAAICYDSDESDAACRRRTKSVIRKGHLACARFAYATFRVSGISRVCSHQLVRHAHLSYLQRSQRYCSESDITFVLPELNLANYAIAKLADEVESLYEQTKALYNRLIHAGVPKGEARYVLAQGATTELNLTGNFQAWADMLALRTGTHAQWEIREVALKIQHQLQDLAPSVFGE